MNGSTLYFPYALGAIASYAWMFDSIKENYDISGIFFLRKNPDELIEKIEAPYIAAFSCYMWNFEYNKILAEKIKKKYPRCIVIFGGPQVSPGHTFLEKYSFIDILIHDEGEVAFKELLNAFLYNKSIESISNVSFRNGDEYITTASAVPDITDFPSPYQSGFFARLQEENPALNFTPLIETNRGCPNHCAYCSWGLNNSKVREFPLERVFFDIEWVSKKKMDFLGFADANFGILPRDEIIADKIIETYKETGYPQKFQVSYSKNSGDRVFRINDKLNKHNMDKGVTLSFQSLSETVQKNIGRSNMYLEHYKKLLKKYNQAGIPTYTDLILGLPGETYSSFIEGINTLLELGQHSSLFVHLCEWLPCAEMGKKDYMEKYKIKYKKIPINHPHTSPTDNDEIQEFSRIITSTYSMDENDWIKMNLFSATVLCFHHLGLLQLVSLYLHNEKSIRYSDFYNDLLNWLIDDKTDNPAANALRSVKTASENVINNSGAVVIFDKKFGNIAWPFEEYVFLETVHSKESFYKSIKSFLKRYVPENIIVELIDYQNFVIKSAESGTTSFYGNYSWKEYFENLLQNKPAKLKQGKVCYEIFDNKVNYSWPEYAKNILWFGRRGNKNIYTKEITESK